MKKTKVRNFLKEKGYKFNKKSPDFVIKQEDTFLRVSLQNPAWTLQDDGSLRSGSVKVPTGKPSREEIIELLKSSGIEETQVVQVDYEIGDNIYSSHWTKV
ncbi:MAG: hypothetical protein GWN14_25415 [candidate division Zixibacteria bacterium]|nr:hypothetical protein [candidate division Zixibacteria bacterium]